MLPMPSSLQQTFEPFSKLPPILRVDDDVLREIIICGMRADDSHYGSSDEFTHFLDLEWNIERHKSQLYILIRICRRFKNVAYANPGIWASIAGASGSEKGFNRLLEMARDAPLTLIHSRKPLSVTQLGYVLSGGLEHVSSLHAHNSANCNWATVLSGRTVPSLSALKVSSSSDVFGGHWTAPPLHAPNLRCLVFAGSFYIPVVAPHLRGLDLSGTANVMGPTQLLDLLSSTPSLQRLSLSGVIPSATTNAEQWEDCSGREVQLPRLQTLKLYSDCCTTAAIFLEHVRILAEVDVHIRFQKPQCSGDMLALGLSLDHCLFCPVFEPILIRWNGGGGIFKVYTQGTSGKSPSVIVQLQGHVSFFEHVDALAQFSLPNRAVHLDLGLWCESPVYDTEAFARALRRIAPFVQSISIKVVDGIVLDFLTDEHSTLDFSALREIKMEWLKMYAPERAPGHWDGLHAWIERVGAKQLDILHLEGVSHYVDRWRFGPVQETLQKLNSKCKVIDERITYGAHINYEPVTGGRENWDWST